MKLLFLLPTVRQMRERTGTGALEGSTMHCVWPGAFCFGKRDLKCILNKWRLESVMTIREQYSTFASLMLVLALVWKKR